MENSKLGLIEAITLVSIIIINHIILNLPKGIITQTGSAALLNVIYISILLFIIGYIVTKLLKPFSNTDIFEICKFLWGKVFKNIIIILYIASLIFISASLIRDFADGIRLIYLPNTKISLVLFALILAACIANLYGFKSISKANLIVFPIILISIIIVFIFAASKFEVQRIFPILGYGAKEIFLTGSTNIAAFGGLSILYVLYPMLKNKKDFNKVTFIAITISTLCLLLGVSCLLFLFPYMFETENILSIYLVTRTIDIGRFVQRIDAIFMLVWILSMFSYLSVIMAFIGYCFKKLTNIKDSRAISYAISLIIFGVSLIGTSISEVRFLGSVIGKYVILITAFGLGILVLILANIKYRKLQKRGVNISI